VTSVSSVFSVTNNVNFCTFFCVILSFVVCIACFLNFLASLLKPHMTFLRPTANT